jgi:tetratricopeptide (TPR) repeat protein
MKDCAQAMLAWILIAISTAASAGAAPSGYERGLALLREGRLTEAVGHLETARTQSPGNAEVLYSLAACYFGLDRTADALKISSELSDRHARDPAVLLAVGSLLLKHQLPARAEELFTQADNLNPGNPMVLAYLARAQLLNARDDASLDTLRRLISGLRRTANPDTQSALAHAFDTASELGRRQPASLPRALVSSELALLQNHYEQALQILEPHRAAGWPNADYCNLLALLYVRLDRVTDATAAAEQALKLAPNRQELVLNLAGIHQKARNNQAAIRVLQRAVAAGPATAEIHFALALSHFNSGNYAVAVASCDRAIALEPSFDRALLIKGRSYSRMSRPREAEEAFRSALRINDACDYCRYELATVLAGTGKLTEAESLLSVVVKRSPENAAAQYQFAKLLAGRGETKAGVAALETAVKADPNHDGAWYLLGRLYAKTGRQEKAAAAMATVKRLKNERRSAAEARVNSAPD